MGDGEFDAGGGGAVRRCRRCGGRFVLDEDGAGWLMCCPHCGAGVEPVLRRVADNRSAAVLAAGALGLYVPGLVLPFMYMAELGQERTYSLLGGILALFERGYAFLGVVLLLFSVVFPFVKLVVLLVITSSLVKLSKRSRERLHRASTVTAKFSMLDVFVVGILVVVIKFAGVAEVQPRVGTILFSCSVVMSIFAGLCVGFDHLEVEGE